MRERRKVDGSTGTAAAAAAEGGGGGGAGGEVVSDARGFMDTSDITEKEGK